MEKATEKKLLQELLHVAVHHFRSGEDAAGMEDFLRAVDELESAAETDEEIHKLLPALRELFIDMQNQDIAGITDWLEYTAVPMAEEQSERCGEP